MVDGCAFAVVLQKFVTYEPKCHIGMYNVHSRGLTMKNDSNGLSGACGIGN